MNKNNKRITIKIKPQIHKEFKKCIIDSKKDSTIQNTVESLIKKYNNSRRRYLKPEEFEKFHINLRFNKQEYEKVLDYISDIKEEKSNQITSETIKREMINCCFFEISDNVLTKLKRDDKKFIRKNIFKLSKSIKFKLNHQMAKKLKNKDIFDTSVLERLIRNLIEEKRFITKRDLEKYLERKHLSIKLSANCYSKFKDILDNKGEDATVQNICKALIEDYNSRMRDRRN